MSLLRLCVEEDNILCWKMCTIGQKCDRLFWEGESILYVETIDAYHIFIRMIWMWIKHLIHSDIKIIEKKKKLSLSIALTRISLIFVFIDERDITRAHLEESHLDANNNNEILNWTIEFHSRIMMSFSATFSLSLPQVICTISNSKGNQNGNRNQTKRRFSIVILSHFLRFFLCVCNKCPHRNVFVCSHQIERDAFY